MNLTEGLISTPGVGHFLGILRESLVKRQSMLLLLPKCIGKNEFWTVLHGQLGNDFDIYEVEVSEIDGKTPAASLGKYLFERCGLQTTPRTITELMETDGLPDAIHMSGLNESPLDEQQNWLKFLGQWARASQQKADRAQKPMALCFPIQATGFFCSLPEADIFLNICRWQGIPSLLDLSMICRVYHRGDTGDKSQWREALLPHLATSDIECAGFLWSRITLPPEALFTELETFANNKGWSQDLLRTWGYCGFLDVMHSLGSPIHKLPEELWQNLLSNEVLCYTPELGWELHTGALALMGDRDLLFHRLWRGQVSLILPIIDAIRLKICRHLTQTYGSEWPLWQSPDDDRETRQLQINPNTCQTGHLYRLLKYCHGLRNEYRCLDLMSKITDVRNELAHFRPITYDDFHSLTLATQKQSGYSPIL